MEPNQEESQGNYIQQLIEEGKEELANNSDIINSFIEFCGEKDISSDNLSFQYIYTIGIIAISPNIVRKLCPELSIDKEGLIDLKAINSHFQKRWRLEGYLFSEKFALMAHQYFRRSFFMYNSFSPRFIDLLWNIDLPEISSYIALDYNRVKIDVNGPPFGEKDMWFGSKFHKEIHQIADGTVKLRPPLDIPQRLINHCFGGAYSLDIKWETKNKIKSFQAEEFKIENEVIEVDGIKFHPVKYVHAEFNLENKQFRHFDGAIHFYTADEYAARRDSDFNYNLKNIAKIKTRSEKLFKMNGNIDINSWSDVMTHFMTGNALVIEYFEGKYPDKIIDILEAYRRNN